MGNKFMVAAENARGALVFKRKQCVDHCTVTKLKINWNNVCREISNSSLYGWCHDSRSPLHFFVFCMCGFHYKQGRNSRLITDTQHIALQKGFHFKSAINLLNHPECQSLRAQLGHNCRMCWPRWKQASWAVFNTELHQPAQWLRCCEFLIRSHQRGAMMINLESSSRSQ